MWKGHPGLILWVQNMKIPFLQLVLPESWAVLHAHWGMSPPCQAPFFPPPRQLLRLHCWGSPRDHHHRADRRKGPHEPSRHWGCVAGKGFLGSGYNIIWKEEGRRMGLSWALICGSTDISYEDVQPKAYRSGASKYQGLGVCDTGGQYCKNNFFLD